MLQLMNVKKFYNKRLVLEISSLKLGSGLFWIKGANGSGKTTLLKMIAGLIPFEGDILFKGISLRNNPLGYRQNTSWAEAEPLFPPFMSGMDLISLYRSIRKASAAEVNMLLELFNVNDYVNNSIGTYSAGMTKKLSLILAFLGNPSLVVLDEPTITLDPDAFTSMCMFILEKQKNSESIFLMSSHQALDSTLSLSCKELTVNNGNVLT
ncbi:ABC-2 type transport system ATP-binding protein [Chitinophaga niastensis]|uniref:ABC-2 type transport system ATP-binding protein n=1 Tax=Chitinophaga niastensis TaxID=536980 RepID=A0A2P8HVM9_CHINA|nr:ABC transporter ATP-binding protein [Chitinophaga niastensis]PSL50291.1 ABC-2 type transport system ATP-binding protein [Chitinophaga niastensis]